MSEKTSYVTAAGLDKLKQELEQLKKVRRVEIAHRIQDAKELGDLSENAEYAAAREDQAFVEGRVLEIEEILKNAKVIDENNSNPDIVDIGDTVMLACDGVTKEYTIVGSNEADPPLGRISNESPLGAAFLGKKKGESVTVTTPKGKKTCAIMDIK